MVYDGGMDQECIKICDAINRIPGLKTFESCCGHGESEFRIYFFVRSLKHLPVLLYYLDPCHVGFRWNCQVYTDCSMCPARFRIGSYSIGKKAYEEADKIADRINDHMDSL